MMRLFAGMLSVLGAILAAQSGRVSGKDMAVFVMAFSMIFLSACVDAICNAIRETRKDLIK